MFRRFDANPYSPRSDGRQRDPYIEMGSHPDCVERVMDQLAAGLPVDCRFVAEGRAVLAHPRTARVLAMPYGTAYALWLPELPHGEAVAAGLSARMHWSGGAQTDLEAELGAGWLFGQWRAEEERWVRAAYDAVDGNVRRSG